MRRSEFMNKQNIEDIYGLTAMQEGMLYHSVKNDSTCMYIEQFSCKLTGSINEDYFWQAWQKVIDDNAVLRTAFLWEGVKKPVQVVLKKCEVSYMQMDWQGLLEEKIEVEYEKFLRNDRNMGFYLENAPLMRFALIQIKEDLHYFVWTFHHIIMDGWSLPLVIEQMLHNYRAIQNHTSVAMEDKKGQYKNYIKWLNDQDANKAKAYWKEVMQEGQDVVAFTQIQSQGENHKKAYRFELELENEIKTFLKKNTLTEYQLFNCAYAIMLSKYFGKENVIYGVTVSGRNMQIPKINEIVGIFINTVPQTVSLQANAKVKDVFEAIKKQQLERSSYEYLSISDICSTCGKQKLFDSIFVLENYANADSYKNIAEFAISDLKLHEEVNFPLAWVLKHEDGICVESVYNTAYFTDEIIESLLNCYVTIISELLGHYEEQVDTIQLVESSKGSIVTDVEDVNGNSLEYRFLQGKKIVITDSKNRPLPNGFSGAVCIVEKDTYANTGYVGNMVKDGILFINDLLSDVCMFKDKTIRYSQVEEKIAQKNFVQEVKLLKRYTQDQKEKMIVYYTEDYESFIHLEKAVDIKKWRQNLKEQLIESVGLKCGLSLEEAAQCIEICPITNMPYNEEGQVQVGELCNIQILNKTIDEKILLEINQKYGIQSNDMKLEHVIRQMEREKVHISDMVQEYSFLKKTRSADVVELKENDEKQDAVTQKLADSLVVGKELIVPEDTVYDLGYYIKRAAMNAPADKGIRFIDYDGSVLFKNYKEIYDEALAICSGLIQNGTKPGDKVIFQLDDNHNYVITFWACMLGGFISVPVSVASSYKEDNATIRKLYNSWKMLERPVIVADQTLLESVKRIPHILGESESLNVFVADELVKSELVEIEYKVKPTDLALLPLTSGSTGMAKAVMQTHKNIILRTVSACQYHKFTDEVTFNWMPMDHVGGTIMSNVRDVYLYCQEIIAPVNYILEAPLRWLTIMSDYKVTNTWAPNFAFNLINSFEKEIKTMDLDFSALKLITNGGEVVVANTTLKFNELLEPFHFDKAAMKPCFGMSETCSGTIYSEDFGDGFVKKGDSRVNVGKPLPGYQLRVVNEKNEIVPMNTEGRFQMTGPSITLGYYNNPEATLECFSPDGWLDTGDIGIISERGLAITGRSKDIIIINGNNYNNSEIEAMIDELDGVEVSYTAAVTVKADPSQNEELAIFFNPTSMEPNHLRSVIKEIQRVITTKIGIVISYVVPLAKKDIPKTGIGKIQRIQLRNALLKGEYNHILKQMDMISNKNILNPWIFKKVWVKECAKYTGKTKENRKLLVLADQHELYKEFVSGITGFEEVIVLDYVSYQNKEQLIINDCKDITDIVYLGAYMEDTVQPIGFKNLVQSLNQMDMLSQVRLLVATNNVYQFKNQKADSYLNASLNGLLSALREEKRVNAVLIDLEGRSVKEDADDLLMEVKNNQKSGKEVCYRNHTRYVWKLQNVKLRNDENREFVKQGGRYIVTGGLGGIGTILCANLLDEYKAKLAILGRSNLEELDQDNELVINFNKLQQMDKDIIYIQADICNSEDVKKAVEKAEASFGQKFDGIIHLAGNSRFDKHLKDLDRYQLVNLSDCDFCDEYNAKVLGTMHLFDAIKENKEAVFIAFSSITSIIGSSSFSAYGAANSFMEEFLVAKANEGYLTKCFAFTMWNNIGMTRGNSSADLAISNMSGQHIIGREDGIRYFRALLNVKEPMLYVGIDENSMNMRPKIKEKARNEEEIWLYIQNGLLTSVDAMTPYTTDQFGNPVNTKIVRVNEDGIVENVEQIVEAKSEVELKLRDIWTDILGVECVGMNDNFFELGGHSLKATQVVSRVKKEFKIDFAINDLFYNPTIQQLSVVIEERNLELVKNSTDFEKYTVEEKIQGVPASFAQQRLWFLKQYDSQSAFYNMTEALKLSGNMNLDAMNQTMTKILERHEGLRTTFSNVDGTVLQILHPVEAVQIPVEDLSSSSESERDDLISKYISEEINIVFDLETGPLVKFKLLKLEENEHIVLLTMHHIISDGWSMGIFVREFAQVYDAIVSNKEIALSPVEWQYADFTKWQKSWFTGEIRQKQIDYWKHKLADITTLDIPEDFDRPALQTFAGKKEFFVYSKELMNRVGKLAGQTGATPFMIYLAAVNVLFARYTGQDDIAIGTPIANRVRRETENTFGFFVNTLVLRNRVDGNPTFLELIERIKNGALEAYDTQDMPFEMLVDELDVERDLSRNPLFQVMFALQNEELPDFKLPDLEIKRFETDNNSAMFDFWISMREFDDGIHTLCEYNTDLYKKSTVIKMMKHLENILDILSKNPELRVKEFRYMDIDEVNEILYMQNNTDIVFEDDLFVHQMFEKQVTLQPNATVLKFEDTSITYAELNQKANQIANYLISNGVKQNDLVGIYVYRSIEMFAGIYGILKAGAGYIPIDPTYPSDRVNYMIQDSEVSIVLTNTDTEGIFGENTKVVDLKNEAFFVDQSVENPNIATQPEDAVYMIYTSGSTGLPKGTINVHRGLRNRIKWIQEVQGLQEGDILLHKTPYCFDVSCGEIFWAPCVGSKMIIAKPEGHRDIDYMVELIQKENITHVHFVPSMLKILLSNADMDKLKGLKKVFCSGETLTYSLRQDFFNKCNIDLYNLYGPTEASVEVTYYDCRNTSERSYVAIGKPIANTQLYVLDEYMNPVPYNVSGELYIAGENVARGYFKRPELTAEKFVNNPFLTDSNAVMYRTGDKVKLHEDGNIEFIARTDNQIKIRGQRVELGEIEKVIQTHPSVKDNAVIARKDDDNLRIVSYIVKDNDYQFVNDVADDKQHVEQWESVFDNAYSKEEEIVDETINATSWHSSYSGETIALEEMDEWLSDTVKTIEKMKPRKVLEIGCGTGMVLFKIAPNCEEYVGIDFSEVGLNYIREHLNGLDNVRLYQKAAHDLGELMNEKFDTIILNSVIQYFPSGQYLDNVLDNLLSMLTENGSLYLGDIRSYSLLENYHTSVELFKAEDSERIKEVKNKVQKAIQAENELLLDTNYFLNFMQSKEKVTNVVTLQKHAKYENEMSKYRYNTIITTKPVKTTENIMRYEATDSISEDFICSILSESKNDVVIFEDLDTKRLAFENDAMKALTDDVTNIITVKELKDNLRNQAKELFDPYNLMTKQVVNGFKGYALWNGHNVEGKYSLVFLNSLTLGEDITIEEVKLLEQHVKSTGKLYTNPMDWKNQSEYVPKMREYIQTKLPEYMVPSFFIILDELPLLPNGKLNTKALPKPESVKGFSTNYEAAKNDIEKKVEKIWESILNIDHIGVNDNFFDIGGHSLLLIQVYYKIKESFKTDLAVVDMFKYSTIRSLSEYLGSKEKGDNVVEKVIQIEQSKNSMKMNRKRMKDLMKK